MSCCLNVVLAPLRAFAPFLLGTEIRFEPLCSIASGQFESHMGQGLGQQLEGKLNELFLCQDTAKNRNKAEHRSGGAFT